MGESLGLLKIVVVQGRRLVIRDFKSSDPYVVVKLGSQVMLVPMINFFFFFSYLVSFVDVVLSFVYFSIDTGTLTLFPIILVRSILNVLIW